jgi:hypothetical protein
MPALTVIVSGNSKPLKSEFDRIEAMAANTSRRMSTIFTSRQNKSGEQQYGEWWNKQLLERDINAAQRSNTARRLLRQRAASKDAAESLAAQNALDDSIEAASRRNLARRLLRERAEKRKGHGANSGAMRETLVLLREIGRGNWNRVPGSLSILLGQLGLMKLLMNPITAAVLGLVAGFAAAYKLSQALVSRLSGLKLPDFHPEYIANHLKKVNQVHEMQVAINKEVQTQIDLHNSAAKAAERTAEATKEHFGHLRKMNEYAEEKELKLAKSERERAEIRSKYSAAGLKLNSDEGAVGVREKEAEAKALAAESEKHKRNAEAVLKNTPSKSEDENNLGRAKLMADEAQKYLDDLEKSKHSFWGKAKEGLIRGYNSVALSGVSGKDLDAAEKANKQEAARRIQAHRDAIEKTAQNDIAREAAKEMTKQAGDSGIKAAEAFMSANDMKKVNAQKNADEADDAAAKLEAQNAIKHSILHGSINTNQQHGAYASPAGTALVDVAKQTYIEIKGLRGDLKGAFGNIGRDFGKVQH